MVEGSYRALCQQFGDRAGMAWGSALSGSLAIALWCTSASAATIVQDVGGNQRTPGTLTLFDPSLGTLTSVQVEGSGGLSYAVVRGGDLSTVSIPVSTSIGIGLGNYGSFATGTISGSESYNQGDMFGSIDLTGALFTILTGAGVNQFIAGNQSTNVLVPVTTPIASQVGNRLFTPGDIIFYSLKFTFNYDPPGVPEPSTWAMMLLGFCGICFTMNRQRRGQPERCVS